MALDPPPKALQSSGNAVNAPSSREPSACVATSSALPSSVAALPQLDTSASSAPAGDALSVLTRHARRSLGAEEVWIFVCAADDGSADQLVVASVSPEPGDRQPHARAAAASAVSGRGTRFSRASDPPDETVVLPISFDGQAVGAIVAT